MAAKGLLPFPNKLVHLIHSRYLFSLSGMSNSEWPHGLQHARLPSPSLFPGVCSNSCPLSKWWHHLPSWPLPSPSPPAFYLSQHQGLFQWAVFFVVTQFFESGEGSGNPLQCSCLENPRNRGAWWAAVYVVAQRWTRLKWLSSSSSKDYILGVCNLRW